MKSNVVIILIITFCASEIVAQAAQDCKEVNATTEVQKFVVSSTRTGCQYRVQSESGKAVKVFVNATSGSKCVKASSDGKSETLCPSGPTNQLTSSPPIDMSAVYDTTSSDATTAPTTEATTKATEATAPTTKPETEGDDTHSEKAKSSASNKQGTGASSKKESVEKADSHSSAGDEQERSAVEQDIHDVQHIRLARDTSNDVTVYYVVADIYVAKLERSMLIRFREGLVQHGRYMDDIFCVTDLENSIRQTLK
ncbi:unnamed protein product [Echinostoma caproni]|uniref:Secreted protein n=1 Tax=Echinostoma caproni TaxID=27848 RepID=A0A183AFI2_9TREM|nr:unnamed protein product [Echinostoma caproni]